ncbi:hypothetical protein ACHAXT_011535 [Thalassiosira profunda]
MALTEEQRKRMEENRKRALERKKKKQMEQEKSEKIARASGEGPSIFEEGGFVAGQSSEVELQNKRRKVDGGLENVEESEGKGSASGNVSKQSAIPCSGTAIGSAADGDDDESLEEFELSASQYVSQTEAQRAYCVPKGTLEVCAYIEKDNPHKKGWTKMKLYHRSEVRRRARKRYGGKDGLIREREKRRRKRSEKDLEESKDLFG